MCYPRAFCLRQDYAPVRVAQNGLLINRLIGYRVYALRVLGWGVTLENRTMEPRLDYYTASPQALKAMLMLEANTFGLSIEKPLLELIKIRVSQLNHCGFCTDMHSMAARQRGETERRLFAVCVWRDSPLFTAREKAALAWCESVATLPSASVSDALFAAVRIEFSEQELVDLTMAVSSISGWNRLAVSFRQQLPNA